MEEKTRKKVNKSKDKKEMGKVKTYLKNFLMFIRDNLEKTFGIFIIISLLFIAIELKLLLGIEYDNIHIEKVHLFKEYFDNIKILFITVLAGIVPYIYAPIVGFIGYLYINVANFATIINAYGYIKGIAIGIIPLIINTIVISIVASLGVYICRKITIGYKISNVKNMNFLNFRIRFYEAIGNEKKAKEYTKKKDEKISKLESKKEKLNYVQIGNTLILVALLEFVSVVIKKILI